MIYRSLIFVLASVFLASIAQAQTVIYVQSDAVAGGNGESWDTAFRDLQDALAVATAGTEVRVAEGTYRPDRGTGDRLATFLLKDGVVVKGGYAGHGATDPDRPERRRADDDYGRRQAESDLHQVAGYTG